MCKNYFNNILTTLFYITVASVVFVYQPSYGQVPLSLHEAKQAVINYHDSGQYGRDIERQVYKATKFLMTRVVQNQRLKQPKKLALVFDIDETTLSNYADLKRTDFSLAPYIFIAYERLAHASAIKATLALYRLALQHNVSVFFITGRSDAEYKPTERNLKVAGYHRWQGLYLEPAKYAHVSSAVFKTAMRKKITTEGYTIILSIGDQTTDLIGGYVEKIIKLPNPYYYVA